MFDRNKLANFQISSTTNWMWQPTTAEGNALNVSQSDIDIYIKFIE